MGSVLINGGQKLSGTINISGAKNAALPILAATVLLDGETQLLNVPCLTDVTTMIRILRSLNIRAEQLGDKVRIVNDRKLKHVIPYELVTKMRASFFLAGPILAKVGRVRIPMPGGCAIGTRPVDIHLKGFEKLGAQVSLEHGFVEVVAPNGLHGGKVDFSFPSVGATENIMMAATLAKGQTIINNAACEPEIEDLANLLNKAGAKVTGAGTSTIFIEGVSSLAAVEHAIIPDRIEAGTMILAGLMTHGELRVNKLCPQHLSAFLAVLQDAGVVLDVGADYIAVSPQESWRPVSVTTQPHPGFPTDMQAQLMAFLCMAQGPSVIREHIFENRFMHVGELIRMGAHIDVEENTAVIKGGSRFSGAQVKATDLRAGAALWLAGLAADGDTVVYDIEHVERGYDKLSQKLCGVGAKITHLE